MSCWPTSASIWRVLKIDPGKTVLPTLALADSDQLEVGDFVLAIGNPFGVGQTVTSGIISALARTQVGISDYGFFIQTDAAINPGNSGGALVTMDGKLVGINTAIYSQSGGSIGIGFAIPANMVASLPRGRAARAAISIGPGSASAARASAPIWPRPWASTIRPASSSTISIPAVPAAAAGLKRGDVIIAINGKSVEDPGSLRFRLATLDVGSDGDPRRSCASARHWRSRSG